MLLKDKLIQSVIGPSGRARSNRQRLLRRLLRPAWLGTLRRTTPLSDYWGYDRGTPIDRYYIERFLDECRGDIRGHVLEVKNSEYTQRFGTAIVRSEVVDIDPTNPHATIVVDLAAADCIPADTFECVILTQTLQYIYQPRAAIAQVYRILRPGGVLLMTVPGIIKMDPNFVGTDYWRFTVDSCAALTTEAFGAESITVRTYGNVLSAIAFLTGLAHEELSPRELDTRDPAYQLVIAARAVKPGEKAARESRAVMMIKLPATSLIICTRNRPQLLSDTVDSVLAGREVPTEIVIIDQSAQPHATLATLKPDRACVIHYVWTHSIGLSRARNEGLAAARHEWLAIIDDDMYVQADWFGALMRALIEASPKAVVTGQVRPSESEVAGGFAPSTIEDQTPAVYQGRVLIEVLSAGNMALQRSAIQDVGLFDERLGAGAAFRSAEDNDLGYRLLEAGYRVLYVPAAIVYHRAWRSKREYVPLRWSYGFGRGAFFAKHLNWRDRFMLRRMLTAFGQYFSRLIRYALVRSRQQTIGDAVFILGMFSGSMKWLLTQTRSN